MQQAPRILATLNALTLGLVLGCASAPESASSPPPASASRPAVAQQEIVLVGLTGLT